MSNYLNMREMITHSVPEGAECPPQLVYEHLFHKKECTIGAIRSDNSIPVKRSELRHHKPPI